MNRRFLVAALASLVLLSTLACAIPGMTTTRGSNRLAEEERDVSDFTGITLATIGTLYIEVGSFESLRIEAEDNLLELFETSVRNDMLTIKIRDNVNSRTRKPVSYHLTVIELDTIRLSSSGDAVAPDLEAKRFIVDLSSSGDLEMGDLDADELIVQLSSSGDMSMGDLRAGTLEAILSSSGDLSIAGGVVEKQDIVLSSSGDYVAGRLKNSEATVRLSSSGDATIRVSDYLNAHLTSSGDLLYYGNPELDISGSGSGDVERLGN